MGTAACRRPGSRLPGRPATLARPLALVAGGCRRPSRRDAAGRAGRKDPQETPGTGERPQSMNLPYSVRLLCLCCASFFLIHMALAMVARLSAGTAVRLAEH